MQASWYIISTIKNMRKQQPTNVYIGYRFDVYALNRCRIWKKSPMKNFTMYMLVPYNNVAYCNMSICVIDMLRVYLYYLFGYHSLLAHRI